MRNLRLLTGVLIGLACVNPVQADKLEKKEVEKIMKSLQSIKKAVMARNSKQNGSALKGFTQHAASPVAANAFYLSCLKKLRFTDEGKRAEAWRKYREGKDDTLNQVYHREAKQMELRYLILTIKAAQVEDRRDMMKPLVSFIDSMLELDGRGFEHLEDCDSSIFTEFAKIENTIDPGDWEMSPTNIKGIYDQGILPHMRKHRDPRLVDGWTSKIRHIKQYHGLVKAGRLKEEREKEREDRRKGDKKDTDDYKAEAKEEKDPYEEFQNEDLPELKWEMCEDLVEYGFQAEALPLMLDVIRDHPNYKEITSWLASLENELAKALTELNGGVLPQQTES